MSISRALRSTPLSAPLWLLALVLSGLLTGTSSPAFSVEDALTANAETLSAHNDPTSFELDDVTVAAEKLQIVSSSLPRRDQGAVVAPSRHSFSFYQSRAPPTHSQFVSILT